MHGLVVPNHEPSRSAERPVDPSGKAEGECLRMGLILSKREESVYRTASFDRVPQKRDREAAGGNRRATLVRRDGFGIRVSLEKRNQIFNILNIEDFRSFERSPAVSKRSLKGSIDAGTGVLENVIVNERHVR